MKVVYSKKYNIDLGPLNYLHPFEGRKFGQIHKGLLGNSGVRFVEPEAPTSMDTIDQFLSSAFERPSPFRVGGHQFDRHRATSDSSLR